ncbi:MAG TPA: hypothetical protein VFX02_03790 [Gammaproteobacteria bacterium]|nr:hypothetical protein [Gammaproteobacteria bacterium]
MPVQPARPPVLPLTRLHCRTLHVLACLLRDSLVRRAISRIEMAPLNHT